MSCQRLNTRNNVGIVDYSVSLLSPRSGFLGTQELVTHLIPKQRWGEKWSSGRASKTWAVSAIAYQQQDLLKLQWRLLTWWTKVSSWQGWSSMSIASHPLSGTPIAKSKKVSLPYVTCGSTNYAKPKLHSATIMTLRSIMLIAVSSASQFAGVIHWISLVILCVFFSEVCITKVFHHIENCEVCLCLCCHWN